MCTHILLCEHVCVCACSQPSIRPLFIHPANGMVLSISDDAFVSEFPVVVLNSVAWERVEVVRIVIKDSVPPADAYLPMARVVDDTGATVPSQVNGILMKSKHASACGFDVRFH